MDAGMGSQDRCPRAGVLYRAGGRRLFMDTAKDPWGLSAWTKTIWTCPFIPQGPFHHMWKKCTPSDRYLHPYTLRHTKTNLTDGCKEKGTCSNFVLRSPRKAWKCMLVDSVYVWQLVVLKELQHPRPKTSQGFKVCDLLWLAINQSPG